MSSSSADCTAFSASSGVHAVLGSSKLAWLPLKEPLGQCLGPLAACVTSGRLQLLLTPAARTVYARMQDSCTPACVHAYILMLLAHMQLVLQDDMTRTVGSAT